MASALDRAWGRAGPGPAEALVVLGSLVLVEAGAAGALPPLAGTQAVWATGALRAAQIWLCLTYWLARGWRLGDLGLVGPGARRGLEGGLLVSGAFALVVALAEAGARTLWGGSFLAAVSAGRADPGELVALLVVGAGVAPLFEELVFRGILYGGLRRRLGPLPAGAVATAVFAAAHLLSARVPWVQAVGGIVFFAAYEVTGSLWAPILVHALGNLALFLLPHWVP